MFRDYLAFMAYLHPLLPFLVLGTTVYFARRAVRAFERRAAAQAELGELRARVAQLEEQADDTTRDVMRLEAANEFAAQLLRGRLSEPAVSIADPASSER